ncbi:MAG TPA: hypothetical protein PL060_06460, partial [bacterium]|nr:hypothetical protein [bacterium]
LGKWSKFYHRRIAELIKKLNFDAVFTIGEDARVISALSNNISKHFESIQDMAEYVCNFVKSGDAIMVKGSRINKLDIIVQHLTGKTGD